MENQKQVQVIRHFSESFKREKVREIERNLVTVWYRASGFMLAPKRNFRRTTDSSGVIRFPNLTESLELTHVNQAWVSDITYYELNGKFAYLTLIMDAYSRKIKGYQVSKTLRADDTTIPALRMAMKCLPQGLSQFSIQMEEASITAGNLWP
ncbi:DDE-type integrase/transposase/recombinase [Algoriphagus terrigena]|uniref:DDE-type integrase/transposase/recombinase n=1 Tax=Algoriphagus terrigena TaxID=344884 RepID=UPI0006867EBE|nr:DDE-type integrase/transposase/recombinase [Algoriphagus terrigena]